MAPISSWGQYQALPSLGPLWGCHSKSHRGSSQPFQKPGKRGGHSLDLISLKYKLSFFGDFWFVFVLQINFMLMISVNNTFCLKGEFGNNCLICKSEKQVRYSRAFQVSSRNIRIALSLILYHITTYKLSLIWSIQHLPVLSYIYKAITQCLRYTTVQNNCKTFRNLLTHLLQSHYNMSLDITNGASWVWRKKVYGGSLWIFQFFSEPKTILKTLQSLKKQKHSLILTLCQHTFLAHASDVFARLLSFWILSIPQINPSRLLLLLLRIPGIFLYHFHPWLLTSYPLFKT